MSIINISGLVLKASSYKEKDKSLTLYTPSIGKIQAQCKAARDPMNHWPSSMDPPILAWFSLFERNHFFQLTEIREINVFPVLREQYQSRLVYYALCQAMAVVPFMESAEELFRLLLETLLGMDQTPHQAEWFYYRFIIQFLTLQGYQRNIHTCVQCQRPVMSRQEPVFFSLGTGSFLCSSCARDEQGAILLSNEVITLWKDFQDTGFKEMTGERNDFFHNFQELDRIISVMVKQVFHRNVASLAELKL